ncbi:MAG: TIGR02270 family protein [Pseudomonadota bacterium]
MTLPARHAIIPNIVEQHAEEAAFLWLLRDAATDEPHYDRQDLARLDERVEAHLDGLRVARRDGFEIALSMLQANEETGELFAASVLALESGERSLIELLEAIAEANFEARPGFIGAIGWPPAGKLRATVKDWLESPLAFGRFLGLSACSWHRADLGQKFPNYLNDPEPLVRASAFRLAGEVGRADLAPTLERSLEDEDDEARFWAAWSLALLGAGTAAAHVLQAHAEARGPHTGHALQAAVRAMSPAASRDWLRQLNGDHAQARLVIQGMGVLGDPQAVPWLIGRMSDPDLARVAGESFSMITGVDLAYDDLESDGPEGFEAGPSPDPADANVALDPDENLPWPEPDLIEQWWQENRERFPAGQRYLLGRTLDEDACHHAWNAGFQRQRRAAAYNLAFGSAESRLENWRLPRYAIR